MADGNKKDDREILTFEKEFGRQFVVGLQIIFKSYIKGYHLQL